MPANTYIDVPGLTQQVDTEAAYLSALGLDGEPVHAANRIDLLRRLRNGAGVTVYTGPEGAAFWSLCSIEIKVRVVPDDSDYTFRTDDLLLWGLNAVGLDPTTAEQMAKTYRDKPPTTRHGHYAEYMQAQEYIAQFNAPGVVAAIVHESYPVESIYGGNEQLAFLSNLREYAALDYEWDIDTLEPHGLAVSTADRNWYLPVLASDFAVVPGQAEQLRRAVADVIRRQPTVWHNLKADIKTQWPGDPLEAFGSPADDTLVMGYLAGFNELGLKSLTRRLLARDPLDYPRDHMGGMGTLPVALAARYAAAGDTRNTFDLQVVLRKQLTAMGSQLRVYEEIERPLVPIIASMEKYGAPVDPLRLIELRDNFLAMEEGIRSLWWAQERLDISKDAETRELVRRRTGYDPGSCKQDVLAKIEDDWMDSILAYRRIRHRRRSFLEKHIGRWGNAGSPPLFTLYSDFNQAGSSDDADPRSFKRAPRSGRLSSSGDAGNLTNQPGDIRSAYVAPAGHVLGVLDYSGLELRTQAAATQDPVLLAVLSKRCPVSPDDPDACPHSPKCGDLHDDTRVRDIQLTGMDPGRVTAKGQNFNGAYGGSGPMLHTSLSKQRVFLDIDTCNLLVDARRKAYPRYYEACDAMLPQFRRDGYGETLFGRRRYDPDLNSGDRQMRSHAERALVNHVVGQGTAADVVKIAMLRCVPIMRHYGAHLAIQVHDELVFHLKEETAAEALRWLKLTMESIELPGLKLLVSAHLGSNWESAKGG